MNLIDEALRLIPSGPPSAPPDLDSLMDELDIELRYTKGRRLFDGATDLSGDHPIVELAWVAPSSSRSLLPWASGARVTDHLPHHYDARSRFTLAHEIGHVLLEQHPRLADQARRLPQPDLERACDRLAAELLMPRGWFCEEIGSAPDLRSLRRTALRASVSMSSTIVRARTLGYGVVGLFLSSNGASSAWSVTKTFGMRPPAPFNLSPCSQSALESMPLKTVTPAQLPLRCGEHDHELTGQMRRTFTSAVVIVQLLDRATPPAPHNWLCTH